MKKQPYFNHLMVDYCDLSFSVLLVGFMYWSLHSCAGEFDTKQNQMKKEDWASGSLLKQTPIMHRAHYSGPTQTNCFQWSRWNKTISRLHQIKDAIIFSLPKHAINRRYQFSYGRLWNITIKADQTLRPNLTDIFHDLTVPKNNINIQHLVVSFQD